jgi:hypothetical protein
LIEVRIDTLALGVAGLAAEEDEHRVLGQTGVPRSRARELVRTARRRHGVARDVNGNSTHLLPWCGASPSTIYALALALQASIRTGSRFRNPRRRGPRRGENGS